MAYTIDWQRGEIEKTEHREPAWINSLWKLKIMSALFGWKNTILINLLLVTAILFGWCFVGAQAQHTLLQEVANSSAEKSAMVLPMFKASELEIVTAQSNSDSCNHYLEKGRHMKLGEREIIMFFILSSGDTSYTLKLQTHWEPLFGMLPKLFSVPIEVATQVKLLGDSKMSIIDIDPKSIVNVVANNSMRVSENCVT